MCWWRCAIGRCSGHTPRGAGSTEVFARLDEFYQLTEDVVEAAGGLVIRFMGDAALVVFPGELADAGVGALLDLKCRTDGWLAERRLPNRLHVNAHVGPVTLGPMGRRRTLDVIGHTVNTTATMGAKSFGLSAQAFRKLTPERRRLFHRFSPPVLYLAEAAG